MVVKRLTSPGLHARPTVERGVLSLFTDRGIAHPDVLKGGGGYILIGGRFWEGHI